MNVSSLSHFEVFEVDSMILGMHHIISGVKLSRIRPTTNHSQQQRHK